MEKTTFNIEGMHCGTCAIGIQMTVASMDGVRSAEVGFDERKGVFEYDPSKIKPEDIAKAIADLGYQGLPI